VADYIDTDDVKGRLKDDFDGLYELPSESDDLNTDIATVEATVKSYVAKRYALPITNDDALVILKSICLDLMEELAWGRGAGSEIPKKTAEKGERARKQLDHLAKGSMTLGGAVGLSERNSGGAEAIVVDGNDPEFTREQMTGF